MADSNSSEKWYFTKEQLENTPSRKCGYDSHKELFYRQKAANFIQDVGKILQVSTLCVCTAIVYTHRFYAFHSFTDFPWHQMATAALFLAAKGQEQPRKLEYVIRVANMCRNPQDTIINLNSERYITQSHDLVFLENVLLQTLGFDLDVDIPHSHIISYFKAQRTSRQEASLTMANASLHLTTMCLQYKPTVVACACINWACKRSSSEIPPSNGRKEWYLNVDPTLTAELLQQLTEELSVLYEACPSELKKKFRAITGHASRISSLHASLPFDTDPKKVIRQNGNDPHLHRSSYDTKSVSEVNPHKQRSSMQHKSSSSSQHQREREYKERNEQIRLTSEQKALMSGQSKVPHSCHHSSVNSKVNTHARPQSVESYHSNNRTEPRDILKETSRNSQFGLANKVFTKLTGDHGKQSAVRDLQVCSDSNKEVQKSDYLLKASVQHDVNSLNDCLNSQIIYSTGKQQIDTTSRSRVDPLNIPSNKLDSAHTNKKSKLCLQMKTNIKNQLRASAHDKTSVYLNKSLTSTLQKELPFSVETSNSIIKQNAGQINVLPNTQHPNGSSNDSSDNPPDLINDVRAGLLKDEMPTPPIIKRPRLFSIENTSPHKGILKHSPDSVKKQNETSKISAVLSPLKSPSNMRNLNYFSTEPELRPVIKKIDQVECFENIICDNTINITKIHHQIPDVMKLLHSIKKEIIPYEVKRAVTNEVPNTYNVKPTDIIPHLTTDETNMSTLVNSLEINPTIICNLSKQTQSVPYLPAVAAVENSLLQPTASKQTCPEVIEKRDNHCKSKKKNKKHKHKDKEKSKVGKIKKHKDKVRQAAQQKELMSRHLPPVDSKLKTHLKPQSYQSNSRTEPRDIFGETSSNSPIELTNKVFRNLTQDHGKEFIGRDSQVYNDSNKEIRKRDYLFKASSSSPANVRNKNYSSTEPELRPVMRKIDQVECFKSLMHNNTININKIHHLMPDVMRPIPNVKKEIIMCEAKQALTNDTCTENMKPPDIPNLTTDDVNMPTGVTSLEISPTIIHNLPEEKPSVPYLPAVAVVDNDSLQLIASQSDVTEIKHSHYKSKKRKMKCKGKEKNQKKYKNKACEKHNVKEPESNKINIYEYKIDPLPKSSTQATSVGLKIQILKDKIKTDISELSQIKIPKEKNEQL